MSDTKITRGRIALAMLASGLLWPAQGLAYCGPLSVLNSMEQALCDAEDRVRAQEFELQRLDMRIKEVESAQRAAETQRWLAEDQRRRDDSAREIKAWMDDFPSRLPRYGQP